MNIDCYSLVVSDSKKNDQIRLDYAGGESIAILWEYEENGAPKDRLVYVPRQVLESFIKLINEG